MSPVTECIPLSKDTKVFPAPSFRLTILLAYVAENAAVASKILKNLPWVYKYPSSVNTIDL